MGTDGAVIDCSAPKSVMGETKLKKVFASTWFIQWVESK